MEHVYGLHFKWNQRVNYRKKHTYMKTIKIFKKYICIYLS